MNFIKNLKNSFDFYIRQKMQFSRKGFYLENEDKDNIFDTSENKNFAMQKEQQYLIKYNLQILKNNSTKLNYLENLYIIEFLESYMNLDNTKDDLKIIDIGSRNWFYATGQHHFFEYYNSPDNTKRISLTGIELDAYRVYSSFYSRYDSAMYHIKNLENTRYIAGDFMKHNEKYDYICCFFPFIIHEPLLHWGLPLKYFQPSEIFKHAYECLNKNGEMIIINQGKEEYSAQQNILKELKISFEPKGEFTSIFLDKEHEIYVLTLNKQGAN